MTGRIQGLDDRLTRLIRRLRHPEVRTLMTAGVDQPLPRAEHVVLNHIARRQPLPLSALAHELNVDLSTASRQVKALREAGLATVTEDPSDRRLHPLVTTPAGDLRLEQMRDARHRALEQVLADWSDTDVDGLIALLDTLVDDLERASCNRSVEGSSTAKS